MDDHVVRDAVVCSFGCRSQINNTKRQRHHLNRYFVVSYGRRLEIVFGVLGVFGIFSPA
jgi:hypothetical protein